MATDHFYQGQSRRLNKDMKHLLATAQVDHDLPFGTLLGQETSDCMLNGLHPKPIASIDKRRSSLEFADEISKVLSLATIVQFLDRAFRDNAAVVGIHDEFIVAFLSSGLRPFRGLCPRNITVEWYRVVVHLCARSQRLRDWGVSGHGSLGLR